MKAQLALGCFLLLPSLCSPAQQPPSVSDVGTLAPGDLDIRKWVFKAVATREQVVTVREEKFLNDKPQQGRDSITCPLHEQFETTLLLINRSFFSDLDEESKSEKVYQFASAFKEKVERASLKSIGGAGKPGTIEVVFDTPRGLLRYVFSVQVEDYSAAKKRVPDFPDITPDSGWTMIAGRTP